MDTMLHKTKGIIHNTKRIMNKNTSHKWLFISAAASAAYWILEGIRESLLTYNGFFLTHIIVPDPMSFWVKSLVICMILLSGITIDFIHNRNRDSRMTGKFFIVLIGTGLCVLYWILASVRDSLINSDLTLAESIFSPGCMFLWLRLLGVFMIALLSICSQSSINRLQNEKNELEYEKKHVFEIINQMAFPVQLISPDGVLLQINSAFKATFPSIAQLCQNEIVYISDIPFYREQDIISSVMKAAKNRTVFIPKVIYENGVSEFGPMHRIYEATIFPVTIRKECWLVAIMWTDITDKIEAENQKEEMRAQLLKAQKMEAIGNLAGGIAHDFNNLITAIQGTSELALMDIGENKSDTESLTADLQDVIAASQRAADLTNQLLLFSRRSIMGFKTIQVNDIISGLLQIIRRLVSENITITTELSPDLWAVDGDRSTIEQVVMNMVVNAKDAMPRGGSITLCTENMSITQEATALISEARPGRFICITISDTGTGIHDDIQENIFEPFFTTKDSKNGTGLGLSVAYGIIQQHKGWINIYSETGSGTTFKIFIPSVNKKVSENTVPEEYSPRDITGQGEHILVVEDDDSVRMTTVRALRRSGYQVTAAIHAEDAEVLLHQLHDELDLLLTDVVLPGKSGIELAHIVNAQYPDMPIILGSGYTDAIKIKQDIIKRGYTFIQKPYEIFSLLKTVRAVMSAA